MTMSPVKVLGVAVLVSPVGDPLVLHTTPSINVSSCMNRVAKQPEFASEECQIRFDLTELTPSMCHQSYVLTVQESTNITSAS